MTTIFIIIFTISLIYLAVASRLLSYIQLLAVQGILLCGIAFLELKQINALNLVFILTETLIFKAAAIPIFLQVIIRRNNITREAEPYVSNFFSLLAMLVGVVLSFLLAYSLSISHVNTIYFSASVSAIYAGIFIIVTRRKIITHIMGYMVLENGIFLLSLAVGNEMPMIINSAILLDILTSVLVLGIFVNKIGNVFQGVEIAKLSRLKD